MKKLLFQNSKKLLYLFQTPAPESKDDGKHKNRRFSIHDGFYASFVASINTVQIFSKHIPRQAIESLLHSYKWHRQIHTDMARPMESPAVLPADAHIPAGPK